MFRMGMKHRSSKACQLGLSPGTPMVINLSLSEYCIHFTGDPHLQEVDTHANNRITSQPPISGIVEARPGEESLHDKRQGSQFRHLCQVFFNHFRDVYAIGVVHANVHTYRAYRLLRGA